MKRTPWKLIEVRGGYHIWQSPDGAYQATKSARPPDTTAGYYQLNSLLRLKGIA